MPMQTQPVWRDEFDTLEISDTTTTRRWLPSEQGVNDNGHIGGGSFSWEWTPKGTPALQLWSIVNGKLRMKCVRNTGQYANIPTTDGNGNQLQWIGGTMTTDPAFAGNGTDGDARNGFSYGYTEFLVEIPVKGPGMFPAVWMYRNIGETTHVKAEFDLMEIFGDPAKWHSTTHGPADYSVDGGYQGYTSDFMGPHRYGVDWQPDWVRFYRDGQFYGEIPAAQAQWFRGARMGIRMDYAANPNFNPNQSTAATPAELYMDVSYVRYYPSLPTDLTVGPEDPYLSTSTAPTGTISDVKTDFGASDLWGQFVQRNPDVTLVGERARVPMGPGYAGIETAAAYKLTGGAVAARMYAGQGWAATSTSGDTGSSLIVNSVTGGTRALIQLMPKTSTIRFHMQGRTQAYWDPAAPADLAYNATSMAYVRIREAAGQVYFETSPDRTTWTIRYQVATPAWAAAATNGVILSAYSDVLGGYAEFDDVNVALVVAPPPAVPTISSAIASFDADYGSMTIRKAGASLVAGRARLVLDGSYPGMETPKTLALAGGAAFARMYLPGFLAATATEANSSFSVAAATEGTRMIIQLLPLTTQIKFANDVGYNDGAAVTIAYNSTAHAWVRIRETSGIVYFETSPDAVTWTVRKQVATPAWAAAATSNVVWGTFANVAGGYAELDSLNVLPAAAVADAGPDQSVLPWQIVTLAATGSGTWTQKSGTTAQLTISGTSAVFRAPATMTGTTLVFSYGGDDVSIVVSGTRRGIVQSDQSIKGMLVGIVDAAAAKDGAGNITVPYPVVAAAATATTSTLTYAASTAQMPNPERGWSLYTEARMDDASGANFVPLDQAALVAARTGSRTVLGSTIYHSTVVFRYYILQVLQNVDTIPARVLELIAADFATARAAGVKLMPRFVYSNNDQLRAQNGENGPYGTDTTPTRTFGHVNQLKATIDANADVIHAVEQGFIGTWGEQYYSDNWGKLGVFSQQNWDDRARLLSEMLKWDARVKIMVRYPGLKRRYIREGSGNGWAVPTGATSRIGFHNDAFLAPYDDYGTYGTSPDGLSVAQMRAYLIAETTLGVPLTGESETEVPATPTTPPIDAATAKARLAAEHWTTLNPNYRQEVLNNWSQADKDEIGRKLGYSLRLTSADLPATGVAGSTASVVLRITNDGYGVTTMARPLQLVFVNGGTVVTRVLTRNVQSLTPGANVFTESVVLPTAGTWSVHLAMPDWSLPTRAEYAIRLSNAGMAWSNGRNDLGHSVVVS